MRISLLARFGYTFWKYAKRYAFIKLFLGYIYNDSTAKTVARMFRRVGRPILQIDIEEAIKREKEEAIEKERQAKRDKIKHERREKKRRAIRMMNLRNRDNPDNPEIIEIIEEEEDEDEKEEIERLLRKQEAEEKKKKDLAKEEPEEEFILLDTDFGGKVHDDLVKDVHEKYARKTRQFLIDRETHIKEKIRGKIISKRIDWILKNEYKIFFLEKWNVLTLYVNSIFIKRFFAYRNFNYEDTLYHDFEANAANVLRHRTRILLPYAENTFLEDTAWSFINFFNLKKLAFNLFLENHLFIKNFASLETFKPEIKKVIFINDKFLFFRDFSIMFSLFESMEKFLTSILLVNSRKEINKRVREFIFSKQIKQGCLQIKPLLYNIRFDNQISITFLIGYIAWRPVYEKVVIYRYKNNPKILDKIAFIVGEFCKNILYFFLMILGLPKDPVKIKDHKDGLLRKLLFKIKKKHMKHKEEKKKKPKKNKLFSICLYFIKSPYINWPFISVTLLRFSWLFCKYSFLVLWYVVLSPFFISGWILEYLYIMLLYIIKYSIVIFDKTLAYIAAPFLKIAYMSIFYTAHFCNLCFRIIKRILKIILYGIATTKFFYKNKLWFIKNVVKDFKWLNWVKLLIVLIICIAFYADINFFNLFFREDNSLVILCLTTIFIYLIVLFLTPLRRDVIILLPWIVTLVLLYTVPYFSNNKGYIKEIAYLKMRDSYGDIFQYSTTNWIILSLLIFSCCIYLYIEAKEEHIIDMFVDNLYINRNPKKTHRYSRQIILKYFIRRRLEYRELKQYKLWLEQDKPAIFFEARENPYNIKHFTKSSQNEKFVKDLRKLEIKKFKRSKFKYQVAKVIGRFKRRLARRMRIPYLSGYIFPNLYSIDWEIMDLELPFEFVDDYFEDFNYTDMLDDILTFNHINLIEEDRLKTLKNKNKSLLDHYRIAFNDWYSTENEMTDQYESEEDNPDSTAYDTDYQNYYQGSRIDLRDIRRGARIVPRVTNVFGDVANYLLNIQTLKKTLITKVLHTYLLEIQKKEPGECDKTKALSFFTQKSFEEIFKIPDLLELIPDDDLYFKKRVIKTVFNPDRSYMDLGTPAFGRVSPGNPKTRTKAFYLTLKHYNPYCKKHLKKLIRKTCHINLDVEVLKPMWYRGTINLNDIIKRFVYQEHYEYVSFVLKTRRKIIFRGKRKIYPTNFSLFDLKTNLRIDFSKGIKLYKNYIKKSLEK